MRNEPIVISLLLFAALFLADEYGWLTSLAMASGLTMLTLYSPILKLGDTFWRLSRRLTILSSDGNVAFVQRVVLKEEGVTTLWVMIGPLLFVPSLLILRYASAGLGIDYIIQTAFTTALLSIIMIIETSTAPQGTSLRLIKASILSGLMVFISAMVTGYASDLVSVSLSSSYISVLLTTDIRNVPYLASNGITNVVIGGQGVRDALVTVPITTSSLVWLLLNLTCFRSDPWSQRLLVPIPLSNMG